MTRYIDTERHRKRLRGVVQQVGILATPRKERHTRRFSGVREGASFIHFLEELILWQEQKQ